MAELLIRYSTSKSADRNAEQSEEMAMRITSTVLAITTLKELPREIRQFEEGEFQPDFHAKITFLASEVPLRLIPEINVACFKVMQQCTTITQLIRVTIVREEGEFEVGMGNLTNLP